MKDIGDVYILGAGGHTRSLVALMNRATQYKIRGIYDPSPLHIDNEMILGIPVFSLQTPPSQGRRYVISSGLPQTRKKLFTFHGDSVVQENLIDPSVLILSAIKLGAANHIFAGVVVTTQVEIGDNNLINTGCIIEHECSLGSHNHISIGSKICGRVKIGSNCFIGAGATIINNISICDDVVVGAGAVVTADIKEPGTWIGIPAKPKDNRD